ncbi:MAG: hypothetical protein ABI823_13385, partial [Bryobacteraceae bacterium]
MRAVRTPSILILLALVAMIRPSFGCTILPNSETVGPNFRVRFENSRSVVKGLRVKLRRAGEIVANAVTDENGLVSFRNM